MQAEPELNINKRTFRAALKDVSKTAKAVNLVYVSNNDAGIQRKRIGDSFYYVTDGKKINDKVLLERIKKLVIPPAWEAVWICKRNNGHLQVTGTDKLGRKQYRYHPLWNAIRNQTKFFRLLEFGKQLPAMRQSLQKNLALPGYPRDKVLAAVVSLLELTKIRIGNSFYEKLYGSFGLTTMKNHHVKIEGSKLIFSFKGKKGVQHKIGLSSRKLANIIKGCREIPGKELFEYIDDKGTVHKIDSGMVNEYIRSISSGGFTAKDFRTWAGSVQALIAFKELGGFDTTIEMNHKIPAVFDRVAEQLGNTRTVCRKYYVHPVLVKLYEDKKLDAYLQQAISSEEKAAGFIEEEAILLKILEDQ